MWRDTLGLRWAIERLQSARPRVRRYVCTGVGVIAAVAAWSFICTQYAFSAESMPSKGNAGGDCTPCHSSATPSKSDLYQRSCLRNQKTGANDPEASTNAPDYFILGELSDIYVPVVFPHRLHASMESMADGCMQCHHHSPDGKPQPCKNCHNGGSDKPDNLRQPGLKGAYHRQCLACHREWSHDTDCVFCHAKRAPGQTVEIKTDPGDVTGRLHPNVETPEKWIYPTPGMEADTMVTFHHREHVEQFGQRCVHCHKSENCSRCHDTANPQKHVRQDPHEDCTKCHDVTEDCGRCHMKTESPGFDHFRRSSFMLKGYHQTVGCKKCHTNEKTFAGLKRECSSCHQPEWFPANFDHTRTGLKLDDNHAQIDCAGCHVGGLDKPIRCDACHDDGRKLPDTVPGTPVAAGQSPTPNAAKPQ